MKRRIPQSGDQWFQSAVRYLAQFDRTAAQVERFLTRKGASSAQVKQILSRLSTLRYLDDRAYAARWIEATLARRPMAVERLKSELLARGLSEAVADEMINKGMEAVDEEALARRVVLLQSRQGRRFLPQRVAGLLRRRGFAEDTIERIIRDCTQTKGTPS